MSNRFHSKYHRHSHHSASDRDPRYPDAAHDPIASFDSPFLGDFVMFGSLSATGDSKFSELPGLPTVSIVGTDANKTALKVEASQGGLALQVLGDTLITGNLSAGNISFDASNLINPLTATTSGNFMVVNILGVNYGVRLWNL